MATVSDIEVTPLTRNVLGQEINHIDALLDKGPDWNFLTGVTANTIYYTFSTSSGNEKDVSGQEVFTQAQQIATRSAFEYIQHLTGIQFVETTIGTNAQIHLANMNIQGSNTTGLCSWKSSYSYGAGNVLGTYTADAYVYLDNVEWRAQNRDLEPGGMGYQTLLHELGHALGLKHPFDEDIHLSGGQDNTGNTLMSYTNVGGPYANFNAYDIAALNWLYGGDGLRGALGVNSTTGGYYITGTTGANRLSGTAFDDIFEGAGGNDVIDGGAGNDTVVFNRVRSEYTFKQDAGGNVVASHAIQGAVTMSNIEQFSFVDGKYQRAQVLGGDTTPPPAPSLSVTKNGANYTSYSTPVFTGSAEANSTVRVYLGDRLVAETRTGADGLYSVAANSVFADARNYSVRATATDAAGNVSSFSTAVGFHVDSTPPVMPTSSMSLSPGGNQPVFSGTAEVNTTVKLVRVDGPPVEIANTTVNADGSWKIDSAALPNGTYHSIIVSEDIAGSSTSAAAYLDFTINSALNRTGDGANNRFADLGAGNNAVDGGAGLDTVVYAGASGNYTIDRGVYGVTVTDKSGANGTDGLYNVERLQFNDGLKALDIDGVAGQVYRVYQAVLGRPAEAAGQGYWMLRMEKGTPLLQVAKEFMQQPEFAAKYGANPTEEQFLRLLYVNILNREPDPDGYAYWLNVINDENRAQVIVDFSEGFENKALVVGSIENGIDYSIDPAWGL